MKRNKGKNKKNTTLIIGSIFIGIIMISILIQGISGGFDKTAGGSNTDASGDWETAFTSNEKQIFYLGRPSCSWCNKLRPGYNYLVTKYNIKNTYINMEDISQSDENAIFEKLEIDSNDFGTPYIVVMENGKKVYEQVGYLPESDLFKFFQSSGLIDKDVTYQPSGNDDEEENTGTEEVDDSTYKNINFIDYNDFKTIYDSGEKSIIVLGQTGCGYCNQYKPVLDTVAKENGVKVNYIDIRKISEEEFLSLSDDLNSYFKDHKEWGTPLTLIVENKKVVASLVGYNEKSETISFYKQNSLIK